jgi:hypothetical protein
LNDSSNEPPDKLFSPLVFNIVSSNKLSTSLIAESWYNTKEGIFDIDEKG